MIRMSLLLSAVLATAAAVPPVLAEEGPDSRGQIPLADRTWALRIASPKLLSYTESAMCYDTRTKQFVLWGGHIDGRVWSTGPEGELTYLYDPTKNQWKSTDPATMPEGACCVRDIVFDDRLGQTLIFGGHSGAHGWQYRRAIAQRKSIPWAYDAATDRWTAMRPLPEPGVRPYRGAAYDPYHEVTLIVGGEGHRHSTSAYDSYTNTWQQLRPPNDLSGPNEAYSRTYPVLTWSPAHQRFIVFGGSKNNDTWTFDIEANEWQRVDAKDEPPQDRRVGVYDTANEKMLLFGHTDDDKQHVNAWSFDLKTKAWTLLDPPKKPGPYKGNRYIAAYSPDHNVSLFKQEDNRREHFWLFRYGNVSPPADVPPAAPTGVTVVATDSKADLTWKPSPGATGYHVYRAVGTVPWKLTFAKLTDRPLGGARFTDSGLARGKIHFYRVTAVEKDRESEPSALARTQPRVPAEPVVSVLSAKEAEVAWRPSPERDVVGYNLYRAGAAGVVSRGASFPYPRGPRPKLSWVKVNEKPLRETAFKDAGLLLGAEENFGYAYVVRAVNALGVESGPSPYALTIPSNPLRPKADGAKDGAITFTWQANPEKGLVGYNIYRYWRKGEAEKINAEPVKGTRFVQKTDGPKLTRFVIVAANALGQEGIPSYSFWGYWALSQRG